MLPRRAILGGAASLALAPLAARAGAFKAIPQRASARVIVDNDHAGDPDALVALAHQLLTPKARTVLITNSPLELKLTPPELAGRSAAAGSALAAQLCRRLGVAAPPIATGAERPGDLSPSPAARAIVAEAMRDDSLPLIFTCGGPLTNLAAALALEPAIAGRMKLIWIGGGNYPAGGWEYNLATDLPAARAVIEGSTIETWQVPQGAYRQMQFSIAALGQTLRPISPFTAWLYDRFTSPPDFVDIGGTWPLGDTPTVLLSSISAESSTSIDLPARRLGEDGHYGAQIPGRTIKVFTTLDARLAFDDLFALLHAH